MADDEVDLELLDLLRKSLGINNEDPHKISSDTGVLKDAEFIYNNSIDVFIDMYSSKAAASAIHSQIQERGYSTASWSEHELHPRLDDGFSEIDVVNFVFTMDLLNFSFWSDLSESQRYQVEYRGKRWIGYNSLVACLRRALDENIPITTPRFWRDQEASNDQLFHVFRSATQEHIPLLEERISILRETGRILHEMFGDVSEGTDQEDFRESLVSQTGPDFSMIEVSMLPDHTIPAVTDDDSTLAVPRSEALDDTSVSQEPAGDVEKEESASREHRPSGTTVLDKTNPEDHSDPVVLTESSSSANHTMQSPSISTPDLSVIRLIEEASHSAGKLVNLLVKHLPSFRDETRFDGRKVRFYKRAQIFVADLWAATNGRGYGTFHDIDHLTMFADYRVPQILTSLGILSYSPPLHYAIKDGKLIPSGHSWEVQLRGCSIWGVELIRREILKIHPEAINVNAVLIDFFLYDLAKEREQEARSRGEDMEKCHRVRSIWY